ncbi:MAG: hypothetical protein O7G87_01175, partial [bacterium]|nr:hypothetical protein [bacterium]
YTKPKDRGVCSADHGSTALSVELERRIGEKWKLEVESRAFFNTSNQDVLGTFGSDDFTSVMCVCEWIRKQKSPTGLDGTMRWCPGRKLKNSSHLTFVS